MNVLDVLDLPRVQKLTAASKQKLLQQLFPGLVQCRKTRSTGTMVSVWCGDGHKYSDPESGECATLCEDHGFIIYHPTKEDALTWASHPEDWCDVCRERGK